MSHIEKYDNSVLVGKEATGRLSDQMTGVRYPEGSDFKPTLMAIVESALLRHPQTSPIEKKARHLQSRIGKWRLPMTYPIPVFKRLGERRNSRINRVPDVFL